ncbi:MAG: adenylate/guanylate cyclase domain-containing protein [Pseudomonadota bacterium]
MEAEYTSYDYTKSIERINEILGTSDSSFEDKKSIPSRDSLTFKNGFYVSATALFVDIRDSKDLNNNHQRPTLAKIYKTYISETVAVLKGNEQINEIYIEGDGVWAIFDTPYQKDINNVFSTAAKISSIVDILNIKYKRKGYSTLTVGIGVAYGDSLYIKAGHKGSGINEVVWLGKLVGEAAELCSHGNKSYSDREMMVSSDFYFNLNDNNKKLLEWNFSKACYHGNVVNVLMDNWVQVNA